MKFNYKLYKKYNKELKLNRYNLKLIKVKDYSQLPFPSTAKSIGGVLAPNDSSPDEILDKFKIFIENQRKK